MRLPARETPPYRPARQPGQSGEGIASTMQAQPAAAGRCRQRELADCLVIPAAVPIAAHEWP